MGPGFAGRTAVLLTAVTALTAGAVSPSFADTTPDPRPHTSAEVLRPVAPPPASNGTGSPGSTADADGIRTSSSSRPVAPGIALTSYDRLESDKWLRVDSLSVDLDGTGARADYLSSGKVSDRHPVSELAALHDAGKGRRTVAALNADFFDINETGAPQGPGIEDGRLVQSPAPDATQAHRLRPRQRRAPPAPVLRGHRSRCPRDSGRCRPYNAANIPAGGVGVYTPAWGDGRPRPAPSTARHPSPRSLVRGGRVVSVARQRRASGAIPDGTTVLVGREAGRRGAEGAEPGRPGRAVDYRARAPTADLCRGPPSADASCSSSTAAAQNHDGEGNNTAAPAHRGRLLRATAGRCTC